MFKICHVIYNCVLSRQIVTWPKSVGNWVLPHLMNLFSCPFDLCKAISRSIEKEYQYITSCDWGLSHSFVYNVPSATVTVRYNNNFCNCEL
jgi:hypothetical protein